MVRCKLPICGELLCLKGYQLDSRGCETCSCLTSECNVSCSLLISIIVSVYFYFYKLSVVSLLYCCDDAIDDGLRTGLCVQGTTVLIITLCHSTCEMRGYVQCFVVLCLCLLQATNFVKLRKRGYSKLFTAFSNTKNIKKLNSEYD